MKQSHPFAASFNFIHWAKKIILFLALPEIFHYFKKVMRKQYQATGLRTLKIYLWGM
jgi:hypothetical protein